MFEPKDYDQLRVTPTTISGLFEVRLQIHSDDRGWFKENYQKEKLEALGLPSFEIVQNNFTYSQEKGVTRGLHMEPWVKFISVASGSVFAAWVDLRKGPGFGTTHTMIINPGMAVFVPRGVANGYQTLEKDVVYTYLVDAHWSANAQYTMVNAFDPVLGINWPIGRDQAIFSDKDAVHPLLSTITPLDL